MLFFRLEMFISFFISISTAIIPLLTEEKLKKNTPFLIFHYLKRNGVNCPLCQAVESKIPELDFKTYKLNPFEQQKLGLQFFRITYPSFTVHDSGKFYDLNVNTLDDLHIVLKNKKWRLHKQIYPKNLLRRLFAFFLAPSLSFLDFMFKYFSKIPTWIFTLVLGFLVTYLIYSVVEIFTKY